MLYLSYIIRNWYPAEPGGPMESILEPRMFDFDASDGFFQEAIGSPVSTFANEIGTPEIPSEIAHRLASALEDFPAEEDILFAICSPFQAAAVLALCDKWAELKASARERMA